MTRLKKLRQEKDLTLLELREELKDKQGITFSTSQLSSFENGKRSPRRKDAWELIADYFNVSVPYLLGYDNDFEKQIRIDTLNNVLNKLYQTHDLLLETASKDFWKGYTAAVLIVQTQEIILEFEESANGK
ncbi:helix-turn-helix domain-containing protein [Streptococcus lutetiensis]|uniref:helix-turn-helix domain-containing protein n=1 Tax=Streptococcus lutetiensis TaxID=150055 RepID=UPI001BDA28DF|nr:helix-turn-helix transcriptional regulator [Streptococcus lutetiensis]MBT0897675.1 helix-turn-helix domain-containing protein [Streptococcus lutetiensis]MBT1056426.1 helix-turn-helix domain-containing protein [Streptococcus lutetiensis]MBT1058182.1 helix-turn-helix domain-containing protein [Streptococcus lutetiensis]